MKWLGAISLFLTIPLLAQETQTPEDKQAAEAAARKAEIARKNKLLTDTYNAGLEGLKAGNYQTAIDEFNKASEIDARQVAIWAQLGEAYKRLARTLTGDAQTDAYNHAIESYKKSMSLKPDPALFNQLGTVYDALHQVPEATEAFLKAAELSPTLAPKAYFNLGATLVNNGEADKSVEYFKKAVDADPTYADAWYQYGALLLRKGTLDEQNGVQVFPADCKIALTRYLELMPNGINAGKAKEIMEAMDQRAPRVYWPVPKPSTNERPSRIPAEATLLQKIQPAYSIAAKDARIQGTVKLQLFVSKRGEPIWMHVLSSPSSLLSIAAETAVQQWRYEPLTVDGKLYEFSTVAVVNFNLTQ